MAAAEQPTVTVGEVNPVTEFPLLSWPLRLLDGVGVDLGLPLWFRAAVELAVVCVALWIGLRLVLTRLVPWLGHAGVTPWVWLVGVLRAVFLFPDLAVATAMNRLGRRPAGFVYAYGDGVLAVADTAEAAGRAVLSAARHVARTPKVAILVLVVGTFLVWNDRHCVATAVGVCESPARHWMTTTGGWFDNPDPAQSPAVPLPAPGG